MDFKIKDNVLVKYTGNEKKVIVPEGIKSIDKSAFSHCETLETIEFPKGLETIGWYSFYDCKNLKNIELPTSLKLLSSLCFEGCTSLTEIDIPDSVEIIGDRAFSGCTALRKIKLPLGLKKADRCIEDCPNLVEIEIPDGVIVSLPKLKGCYVRIDHYEINYTSMAELDRNVEQIELPTGLYESYRDVAFNIIENIGEDGSVGCDCRGNMFFTISKDIPCFDSSDRERNSYELLIIFPHEDGMFALYRSGGYKLSKQRVYYGVIIEDEKTAALLKAAEEEWQRSGF